MSDVGTFRHARGKLRADRPLPTDGICEGCDRRVGRNHLKWHHCHDCGRFVSWLCNDCNLSLTEHAIKYWHKLHAVHAHECHHTPAMFDVDPYRSDPEFVPGNTRRLYMSNGGGDDRYISTSDLDGFITVEQLAAICGVNANTARNIASGRNGTQGIGTRIGGAWFISHDNVLAHLEKRWNQQQSSPT